MATIDWPAGLIPQTAQLALRKSGAQFASPFNGTLQSLDFIAERWVLSCSLAPQFQHDPSGVGVFANLLAGGVERVRVWPFHTGGAPRGTLRGAPTLAASVARGATTLALINAQAGVNLLRNGGFEIDSSADGLADWWSPYAVNGTGSYSFALVSGQASPWAQQVSAAALGVSDTDRVGLLGGPYAVQAGQPYALSVDALNTNATFVLNIDWAGPGGGYVSSSNISFASSPSFARRVLLATAPPGAAQATVFAWISERGGSAGPSILQIDNAQLERAPAATPYAGRTTLLAGDFIGCGGQLFQVASDVASPDNYTLSVPLINRVRGTIAINSLVTWYRPTCEMVLPAMQAGPVRRPGVIESTALDLVEVW
jgi:hypothetical protein